LSVVGTERLLESGFFREVIPAPHGRYYGLRISERTLVPDDDARLGETRFADWLTQATKPAAKAGGKPA